MGVGGGDGELRIRNELLPRISTCKHAIAPKVMVFTKWCTAHALAIRSYHIRSYIRSFLAIRIEKAARL